MTFWKQEQAGFEDEIRDHIERETQDNVALGMTPEEAHRRAMVKFGNVAFTIEETQAVWAWRWLDEARRDIHYAVRTLRKSPAFAATAIATLAMAIGACTAMVSVLHAVVLQPLPYRLPEQLTMLWIQDPAQNLREGRSTLRDVDQWRTQSASFADIATFDAVSVTLSGDQGAEQLSVGSISPNLLTLLGVQPAQGRGFSVEDADPVQPRVLISHRFWQARFGGSTTAIGSTVVLNDRASQVIGILPAEFQVATLNADIWVPHTTPKDPSAPDGNTWFVIGRLRPAVTVERAQEEMRAIARRLNDQLPAAERSRSLGVVPLSHYLVGRESRLALWMLGGAVFVLFLIAAANVTGLSVARSVARAREMAVRAALGASAGRIVRQLVTESVVLAVCSGVIGTLLAWVGIRFIRTFGPTDLPRLHEMTLNAQVLGSALALSLFGGILVGVTPALATLRRKLRAVGEQTGRSNSGGAAARGIRRALVVAEFALAIVLLVGAGLLVRSWWNVASIDPGFRPDRVLVMELSAPPAFSTPEQRSDLYARVLEQMQATAGVEHVGIVGDLFVASARGRVIVTERNGQTVRERLQMRGDEVSADFFNAMGTPLRRGRFFSAEDGPKAPPVAIVNDTMARRVWPDQDAVGRRFRLGPGNSWITVVGVVADMRRQGLERDVIPQMFVPLAQGPPGSVDILIRTASDDPLAMTGALRASIGRVERNAPVYGVEPLSQEFGAYLTQRRFQTSLLTGFSMLALLLAAVGIYGLIQYSVATRTQEIGLRKALGAGTGDIFRLIVGEGLMLSFTGIALGLVAAWWIGRAVSSLLFGVTAGDPMTFITVSLLLTVVAAAASYVPARRAMNVEAIAALRAT